MRLRISWSKAIFVLLAALILNVNNSFFHLQYDYYYNLIAAIALILGPALLLHIKKRGTYKLLVEGLKSFIVPWAIVTTLSVITSIVVYHTNIRGDYTQSIRRFIHVCVDYLIAYMGYRRFKKKSLFFLTIAGMMSYATVVIRWLLAAGIDDIMHPFNHTINGITLEVHELTYIFGILFLYYLLSKDYDKNFKMTICIALAVAIILGNKRALYLGMVISLFVYWLFHKFDNKNKQLLRVIAVIYFLILFTWLYIVRSGMLELLILRLGINSSSRFSFWNYFKTVYWLSPSYLGRGLSYTDNVLATSTFKHATDIWINTHIHNDILKAYIGWGFMPFVYYFFNFFVLQVKKFVKFGRQKCAWRYFVIISCVLSIYFFDSMLEAFGFNITLFLIWFALMDEEPDNVIGVAR